MIMITPPLVKHDFPSVIFLWFHDQQEFRDVVNMSCHITVERMYLYILHFYSYLLIL